MAEWELDDSDDGEKQRFHEPSCEFGPFGEDESEESQQGPPVEEPEPEPPEDEPPFPWSRVVVINMSSRPDRWAEFQAMASKMRCVYG